MKTLRLGFSLGLLISSVQAQTTPGKLTFALPVHPGQITVEQGRWQVVELSAKSNGNEWGERAAQDKQHMLAFLFAAPDKAPLTANSCRDGILKAEHAEGEVQNKASMRSKSGVDIALAVLIAPKDARMSLRAFVASGDLCGDFLFNAVDVQPGDEAAYRLTMETAKQTLLTLTFDPGYKPAFKDAFAYANVEFMKHQYAGAATAFRAALELVDQSDDPLKFRRVVTDQLSMSLGISGDLKGSREVNEAAIARDAEYPLYYYNLSCTDAERVTLRPRKPICNRPLIDGLTQLAESSFPIQRKTILCKSYRKTEHFGASRNRLASKSSPKTHRRIAIAT